MLIIAFFVVFIWWIYRIYIKFTIVSPAYGGQYIEGVVKQPRFINPLLAPKSSTTDKIITKLVFSGLFDYDENGLLRKDLVDNYEILDGGKKYLVHLKKDIKWHDGKNFSANDVIYTINVIKSPDYTVAGVSSDMRLAWTNIKVTKEDDYTLVFELDKPRSSFLHLLTIGILPEHIWSHVSPEQFNVDIHNLKPVGIGPYVFVDVNFDSNNFIKEYILRAYKGYHRGEPYITKFVFRTYPDRDSILEAYISGEILGITVDLKDKLKLLSGATSEKLFLDLPSYYAVFFNRNKSVPLAYKEVREALNLATNKEEILESVFGNLVKRVDNTLLLGMNGYDSKYSINEYNINKAKELLDKVGYKMEGNVRKKDGNNLSFELVVRDKPGQLAEVAEKLKEQWSKIGVDVKIVKLEREDLVVNKIKPMSYDALLYSHPLRWDNPSMKKHWYSKSKEYPGLNFSHINDDNLDKTIDALEIELDNSKRAEYYKKIQQKIKDDSSAEFLFAPGFFFVYSDSIHNIPVKRVNASYDRFVGVEKWYINEKRIRK